MKIKYKIKLTRKDRVRLKGLIGKGAEKARTITRCRILLLADQGQGRKEISEALSTDPNTVRTVCSRYCDDGLDGAIYEKPRPGARTIFDGKARAKITALACSKAPDGYGKWSLRLLADKAVELEIVDSISHNQIGKILKKTK